MTKTQLDLFALVNAHGYPVRFIHNLPEPFTRKLAAGEFTVILSHAWTPCRDGDCSCIKSILRHHHCSKRTLENNA